ncbi:MAG: WXG100 family type VII secretion target [Anaerolineaceae bacterium]
MAEKTIVNYEQLQAIVKKFNNEGEEIAKILGKLRERVHHMQSEWIGAGSDSFFDEMEMEILPAVQRLSEALLFSGKTLIDITKIFNNSEEESKNIFKSDFQNVNLGATDFGAGQFGNLGGVLGGSAAGTSGSEPNLGSTDFGAGQFAGAGGTSDTNSPTTEGSGGPNLGQTDFGAGQFGESGSAGTSGAEQGTPASGEQSSGMGSGDTGSASGSESTGSGSGGAGSGGGGSGSEGGGSGGGGASGNLDSMGSGLKNAANAAAGSSSGAGGGGAAIGNDGSAMPDHVYQSTGGGSGSIPSGPQGPAGGTSGTPYVSGKNLGGNSTAAGIAGVVGGAGAAAGGAAKIIKDKNEDE